MGKTARLRIPTWLPAVVASATLFLPVPLRATEFPRFSRMSLSAQAEYVALMIDATENALRAANQSDLADRVHELFTRIEPGASMPLGLVQYGRNEALARLADLERYEKDPNARRLHVEAALFVTLDKNGVPLSTEVKTAVVDGMARSHTTTYAEFKAKTTDEQRKLIALLVRLAYPHFRIRDAITRRIEGKEPSTYDNLDMRKREATLIAAQFPIGAAIQPGFAGLAREIDAEYRKTPNDAGPFYCIVLHMFDMVAADLAKEMKRMEDSTLQLPQRSPPRTPPGQGKAAPAPAPTPKTASPPPKKDSPGFGDAIGEGGFITPPTR